ncbi:Dcm Site-specific DNA methylase [uncultured Caudovirales phage]|uniref:Cytosine-specific methyltransferase n=1 Tax=uncultured Caudovirales phage TaxID=2100421 RepID=A0A6J5M4V2_9CAUD|nr:Dcm Site-specific DNA methylase [uncultured Caudovirales phage]
MTHASLFSGIGGFDLAAEWMGWENLFHCEWNPFGQRVLKHHFPNSISYNDITKTDFSIHKGQVDILTGGFPCQPYSSAGKRLGKEDERHLFPEMLRTIEQVQPRWVVGENVLGLVNWNGGLVFEEVQTDLEAKGYEVQAFILPACAKNAPHRRDRVWFVAYSNINGLHELNSNNEIKSTNGRINAFSNFNKSIDDGITSNSISIGRNKVDRIINGESNVINQTCKTRDVTNFEQLRLEHGKKSRNIDESQRTTQSKGSSFASKFEANGWSRFPTFTPVCGGDDGLPRELDNITFSKWRKESIKAYGNAIVPQVALEIFKAINEFELMVNK